jgi:hypothetical protein
VAIREYRANKYQLLKVIEPNLQERMPLLIEVVILTCHHTDAYCCLLVPTGAYNRLGMVLRPSLFNTFTGLGRDCKNASL